MLNLYAQIAPGELFRLLQRNAGWRKRSGIYTPRVVIWMMILQRLEARSGTLAAAVEQLAQGKLEPLLSRCRRVEQKRIAISTGGYCQARQNLPTMLLERSVEEILQRLRNELSQRMPLLEKPVYVVDGSSVQLEHCPELKHAYPPASNQHGESHWPILRVVVVQDVETGMAQRPCWGAMFGPAAVGEQALAERAMDPLPPGAVIIGDRNFGIFATAWAAHQRGHQVLLRLTAERARRLYGAPISQPAEYAVAWRASRWDRAGERNWPSDALIAGRLIAVRVGRGKTRSWLYLFTTLTVSAEEVVRLYARRWNVETDLRSLKQTVRLQRLSVHSVGMMEKELLAAVLAYNLVRAIMMLAARQAGLHPRQLSFTYAYNIVHTGIADVLAAATNDQQIERMERILELVARCRLPRRRKRRSFPRAVWGRGGTFSSRRKTK
jgi:putative transposase